MCLKIRKEGVQKLVFFTAEGDMVWDITQREELWGQHLDLGWLMGMEARMRAGVKDMHVLPPRGAPSRSFPGL